MIQVLKSLPFLFYFATNVFGQNTAPQPRVIDLETLIPNTVDKKCDLAMFTSNSSYRYEFNYSDRVMVLSQTSRFYLTRLCTVLVLINFVKATDPELLFVKINFAHVRLILIFPQSRFTVKDSKLAKDSFRKNIVIYRHDAHVLKHTLPLDDYCKHYNPSCILQGASLKIGYTRVLPYLKMKGWQDIIPGTPIVHFAPLTLSRLTKDVNFKKLSGIEGQLLKYLVKEYGITFYMNAPPEMTSGTKLPNGSWTGKYRMLAEGEVDMLAGAVSGTFEKHQIGEYSVPILYTQFSLCSRNPEPVPNWEAPIKPFPLLGWLLLFVCILVVGPAIWKITKLHCSLTNTSQSQQTVIHITVQAAATLLVEPWLKPPGGPAALIITAWLLVCLILQGLYASNLTAHLSFPMIGSPVKTLQDVVLQKKTVIIYKGGTLDLFMKTSKDPTVQYILKYHTKYVGPGFNYGPSALDNTNMVGTNEVGILRYKVITEGRNPSNYYFSTTPLLKNYAGWLFKKDHFLIPAINAAILRATENGLLHKWYLDQFVKTDSKNHTRNSRSPGKGPLPSQHEGTALTISHLEGIIIFWAMGVSLSTFIFTSEILYNYLFPKKKSN